MNPTVQTLMSVSSTWTTVTAMLTVLTLLGASTVPVCLVTLEQDSSVVCNFIVYFSTVKTYWFS